ncbi:unnamed protein product [Mytilus coruscus]|uniref:Uncharacterized protein n=1 Tax=Mytilus coruscus TaxID=42192 RepID=A0A6J8CJE2_MYTCO|nr:unnamed protein product [Mytilus coruscus]
MIALGLAGATLAKAVKWTYYNKAIEYAPQVIFYIDAYQNLWTSHDPWSGNTDPKYLQAFQQIKDDSWRSLPRLLILTTLGLGALSLVILLLASLIPLLKKKPLVINSCRITSSAISLGTGVILVYALTYYESHYQSILHKNFDDPTSQYPHKDNTSTGFYMAAIAATLNFLSAVVNIANVVILFITGSSTITPVCGLQQTKNETKNSEQP